MPRPGERIAKVEAVAPVSEQLLVLEGKPLEDRHVEYLTFRGLSFEHSEFIPPAQVNSYVYEGQASAGMPAAVRFFGARHCSLEHCTIAHVSSNGLHFSRGCDHDRLADSDVFDIGTSAVKVGETDRIGNLPPGAKNPFPDDPRLETHHIEVTGNDLHAGGRIWHQGQGILAGQTYNNLISHNHIHDFYQLGISVGWTWGYGKSLAHDNIVEYNHIHQIGQGWSNDLAGIYTLGIQPGTILRNNLIHDIECADYIGRGIYLDEGTSDMLVENNIIYNTTTGGFGMNYGRRNTIRNNIFAFGKRSQIEAHGNMQKAPPVSSYVLEHNIFLLRKGDVVELPQWIGRPTDELTIRSNLFWQEGGGEIQFGAFKLDGASKVADPKFVDPDKGDFRLRPGSPAAEIGFQPIAQPKSK
jgi:parallel beta-helix repeat protein